MSDVHTTLILPPRYTEPARRLWLAAGARGWHVVRLARWRVEAGQAPRGRLAIYGEPLFARVVADQLGRVLYEPTLDWLTTVPEAFVHREIRFMAFGELPDFEAPRFVKPADDKAFPAAVYPRSAALRQLEHIDPDSAILTSSPIDFIDEYRIFMLAGRAHTASLYALGGELTQEPGDPGLIERASRFAEEAAAASGPLPEGVVVDVGRIEGDRWAVIEANPIFGSGIYNADPDLVLDALAAVCVGKGEVPARNLAFVRSVETA